MTSKDKPKQPLPDPVTIRLPGEGLSAAQGGHGAGIRHARGEHRDGAPGVLPARQCGA